MFNDHTVESLRKQFAKMGADLQVQVVTPAPPTKIHDKNGKVIRTVRRREPDAFVADITGAGKKEHFFFRVNPQLIEHIQVVDLDQQGRHLLLNVRTRPHPEQNNHRDPEPQKLLMGHDECHWFIAPVPRSSLNVDAAKQALKPAPVQEAQRKAGVRKKHLHKRRQEAFIRQGEWFFVPESGLVVDPDLILQKEPIRRGRGGKPHICEELYRVGGTAVMVSLRHPNGISMDRYNSLTQEQRRKQGPTWTQMMQNPRAYTRGTVKHPDHSTIRLNGWHRIRVNNEAEALASTGVVMSWLD